MKNIKPVENIFFETIYCEDFVARNLQYHEKRVAKTIGLNFNLNEYIAPPDHKLYRCKIIYNNNEIISVEYFPYLPKKIVCFKIVYDDTISYTKKYLNRSHLDLLLNKKNNADEIIIVKNNFITDTSIANIALFYENQWITPKSPLLEGTTRERYISNGTIKEKDITVEMLYNCEKLALLNAMIDFNIIHNFKLL